MKEAKQEESLLNFMFTNTKRKQENPCCVDTKSKFRIKTTQSTFQNCLNSVVDFDLSRARHQILW